MLKTLHRLIENPDGHQNERNGIDEGRENTHTMIAKGFASIGWSFGLCSSKPGEAERKDVGQSMSCIGEQCQGMGEQTTTDLCGHNEKGKKKGEAQRLLCHTMGMIVSSMFTPRATSASSSSASPRSVATRGSLS